MVSPKAWPFKKRPDARDLLSGSVCFDAMVPYWLARARRWQMLRTAFAGRAQIPDRVRGELMGLAAGTTDVRHLYVPDWFASITRLDRAGAERAALRQRAWHGKAAIDTDPGKDRGEAECLELCHQNSWPLVTQDANGILGARRQGTPIYALPDVLMVFVAQRQILATNAWGLYEEVVNAGMHPSRFWPGTEESKEEFLTCCGVMSPPSSGGTAG